MVAISGHSHGALMLEPHEEIYYLVDMLAEDELYRLVDLGFDLSAKRGRYRIESEEGFHIINLSWDNEGEIGTFVEPTTEYALSLFERFLKDGQWSYEE